MKAIHQLNIFAVGFPLLLGLMGIFFQDLLFYALISTMLTGLIQVVLGIWLLFHYSKDNNPKLYLGSVIAYFSLWFIVSNSGLDFKYFTFIFTITPIVLAIYLSLIIYKKIKL